MMEAAQVVAKTARTVLEATLPQENKPPFESLVQSPPIPHLYYSEYPHSGSPQLYPSPPFPLAPSFLYPFDPFHGTFSA